MRGTEACSDCVVTFICDRDPDDAVIFDVEEERALRVLGRCGLVPPLRHQESLVANPVVKQSTASGPARQDWAGGGHSRSLSRAWPG